MAAVHSQNSGTGQGTWVQASTSNPTYIKVIIEDAGEARVQIQTSETNGPGAGNAPVNEPITATMSQSFILPVGGYYINAKIIENNTNVTVEVLN